MSEKANPIADAVNDAEPVSDPLDDIAERTKSNPGAPFEPDALAAILALMNRDRAAFEVLRSELKSAGCRVASLDEALRALGGGGGQEAKQPDVLVELARAAELFHAPDTTGFVDIDVSGHRETWPIRSKGFRRWLARQFYLATGGAPSSEAVHSALNVLEGKALFDGPERVVNVRVGGHDGRIYVDLSDREWRAVEIDAEGWRVVAAPPVRFRRATGMQPLPMPERGGTVESLRPFLNVRNDDDFTLAIAWMVAVLRDVGPYPVLVLAGEQGSAKSTFAAVLRSVLDPNTAPLRALPREDREMFIAATNGHLMVFDNLSGLSASTSDTICRLATGGGFAVRQLYTDGEEVLFDATRPIILNAIEDIVGRPDLADRCLFITLEPIPETRRRSEHDLWAAFELDRSKILGALFDAISHGLRNVETTHVEGLPRMADFVVWAVACEGAIRKDAKFLQAYRANLDDAVSDVIEADPVAMSLTAFMASRPKWSGTAADLLKLLTRLGGDPPKHKSWPTTARALAGRVRRAATFLRKTGVEITFAREGHARTRMIYIEVAQEPSISPPPSAPSASPANRSDQADDDAGRDADSVREKAPNGAAADHADDADHAAGHGVQQVLDLDQLHFWKKSE